MVVRIDGNGLRKVVSGSEKSDPFFLDRLGLPENEALLREEPPWLDIFNVLNNLNNSNQMSELWNNFRKRKGIRSSPKEGRIELKLLWKCGVNWEWRNEVEVVGKWSANGENRWPAGEERRRDREERLHFYEDGWKKKAGDGRGEVEADYNGSNHTDARGHLFSSYTYFYDFFLNHKVFKFNC